MRTLLSIAFLIFPLLVYSATDDGRPVKTFGDYKVFYSTLESTFIEPEIAEIYDITRSDEQGVLNISVVGKDSDYGQTAKVEGTVKNLLGQLQELDFFEIREGKAVYYLAPFTYFYEAPLDFDIKVEIPGKDEVVKPAVPKGIPSVKMQ